MTAARRSKLDALRGAVLRLEEALACLVDVERAASGKTDLGVGEACERQARARRLIDGARESIERTTASRRDLTPDEVRRARGVLEAAELLLAVREAVGPTDPIVAAAEPRTLN